MITSGRGKYKVWLQRQDIGADIVFFLGGGQRSHVGGVVIAEPGKKTDAIRSTGHYDDVVLKPIAEAAAKKYKTKVVAVGGVHVDHATKQEINLLVENCKRLIKKI
jgi:gallate decarboxylase subunit D